MNKQVFLTKCISSWLSHCRQGGRVGWDGGEDSEWAVMGREAACDVGVRFCGLAADSTGGSLFF